MNSQGKPADFDSTLTVSTLNRRVRESLETNFPLCWVRGEISNFTQAASGHVYFTLKDNAAQVRCVMWRSKAQLLGWRLENGQQIDARALVSFYEPRGEFQLNIEAIRRTGQGNLFEQFLRLKSQLEKEGLFAVDRKKALPPFPAHIGIITSPQAAALRDILSALARRAPHVRLTLFPTPVQGENAAPGIVQALQEADRSPCDLLILSRGGGSIEDLWAFNEESVARAIASCAKPVISGIGHETDFTIADFAADLRAPTPTAAAELAAPERSELLRKMDRLQDRLSRQQARCFANHNQHLDRIASQLTHPRQRLHSQQLAIQLQSRRLSYALEICLNEHRRRVDRIQLRLHQVKPRPIGQQQRIDSAARSLHQGIRRYLGASDMKLNALEAGLKQLDPHAVLARGYAIVRTDDGSALLDASTVDAGTRLNISLARGQLETQVMQVVPAPEAD